jgi:hypothetical protein
MSATNVPAVLKRKERANVFKAVKAATPKKSVNVTELISRRNDAKSDLDMWRSLLQTAYYYTVPNYNPWVNMGRGGSITPGQQLNATIYDLTLPIAHQKLVNKLLMGMVPQGQQWVKFVPGDSFGAESSPEYRAALVVTQKITDRFFKILDRSNFYLAVSESMSDTVLSTGIIAINEGNRKKPLRFEAVPPSYVMFEADPLGGFSAVFRDWIEIRVSFIKTLWPEATLPSNKELKDKVTIFECSYIDYEAEDKERYKYCIITDKKEVLYESAGPSWPWVIYRMRKLAGETRGRGPSLDAYPTAATINEAVGDELMAAAFTANPMYMAASDSAFNQDTFSAQPGNIIPVQMIMGEWPIQQFPGGGNINFSAMIIGDFRQQINELLFTAPLGPITAPDKTATEQQIRYLENLESFSALVPRLQVEFMDPTISRCMYLINKIMPEFLGDIDPEIRDQLISVDGELLDLKYETPLMTARGQIKTQAMLGYFQALATMVGPEAAAATFNPAKLVQALAQNSGAQLDLIKNEDEINEEVNAAAATLEESVSENGVPPLG